MNLNPEQRRAVETISGPVLVVAGPGTGKTRVVTHRIAAQVDAGVASPSNVLAVTFTDRAASEMLARLRRLGVPAGGKGGVRAATFHSAALRQVRWFWPRVVGDSAPEVLASKLAVLGPMLRGRRRSGAAVQAPQIDTIDLANEIEWVKAQGVGNLQGRDGQTAGTSRANTLARVELDGPAPRWRLDRDAYRAALAVHEGPWPDDLDDDAAADAFAALFERYEEAKHGAGRIDFEDILAANAVLLASSDDMASQVRGQYTHLTVDEFQDVNRLQWDLLRAWLGTRDDVAVVGDADQAIYGFSGASPAYLDAFRRRFPDATVVELTRNYRSTQDILDLARRALGRDRGLTAASQEPDPPAPDPQLVERPDAQAEREWVIERCHRLHDAGIDWGEIALLYRFNAQSEAWEEAFAAAGIPYRIRGDEAFFARRHVERALRVLRAAQRTGAGEPPSDDPLVALEGAEPRRPALGRLVRRILKQRMSWTEQAPSGERARERWADLSVLVDIADELGVDDNATLDDYLADLDRRAHLGRDPDGGGVNLMTLHRAKGLEFDAVFLVSVEEGRVPSRYAVANDEEAGPGVARDPATSAVAEERRLLYVGLTRARSHLHVTWVRRGAKRPSRFLYGLPGGPVRADRKKSGASTSSKPSTDEPLAPADEKVFEALREWRLERAMNDGVPAFVVFPDSTLKGIARRRPASGSELLKVSGVGQTKLERYGEPVLELVARVGARTDP